MEHHEKIEGLLSLHSEIDITRPKWRQPSPQRFRRRHGAYILTAILCQLNIVMLACYMLSLKGASSFDEMNTYLSSLGALLVTSVICFSAQHWIAFVYASKQTYKTSCVFQLGTLGLLWLYDNDNGLQNHGAFNMLIFGVLALPLNGWIGFMLSWYQLATRDSATSRRFWNQLLAVVITASLFLLVAVRKQRALLEYGFFGDRIPCTTDERALGLCDSCDWQETTPWFSLLPFRQNIFIGPMTCPRDDASFTARIENDELIVDGCPPVMTKISNYYDGRVSYYTGPVYTLLPRTEEWGPAMKNDSILSAENGFQEQVLRFADEHTFQYTEQIHLNSTYDSVLVRCGNFLPKLLSPLPPPVPSANPKLTSLPEDSLNVIVLFIDSMSRAAFHRKLPQSKAVLEQQSSSDVFEKTTSSSTLFEFWRYHSVGLNTGPNTIAMFTGLEQHCTLADEFRHCEAENASATHVPPLWQLFDEAGYTSARIDPLCQDWEEYYNPPPASLSTSDNTFITPKISNEHISYSCLPPAMPRTKLEKGNFAGPTSIKAHCLYSQHISHHELDWAESFISRQNDAHSPFFLMAGFMEGHEGSSAVLSTVDDRLAAFLDAEQGVIDYNNTAVVIVSDHGALMGLNYAFTENGKVEAQNPFLAMMLPGWWLEKSSSVTIKDSRRGNIGDASRRLITGLDVFETVKGFMGQENWSPSSAKGVDLAREGVDDRTCADVGISEDFCRCR